MTKSIFSQLYKHKDQSIFWENKLFFALLDRYPVSPGHSLVIPKREVLKLEELNLNEKAGFLDVILKVKSQIPWSKLEHFYLSINTKQSKLMLEHPDLGKGSKEFNFGINEGPNAGQTIKHLHIHIIPRFLNDVEHPEGGVRLLMGKSLGKY